MKILLAALVGALLPLAMSWSAIMITLRAWVTLPAITASWLTAAQFSGSLFRFTRAALCRFATLAEIATGLCQLVVSRSSEIGTEIGRNKSAVDQGA